MKFTMSIKKRGTFKYILKKGKYFKGLYIVVYISKSGSNNHLGICVTKKHGISVNRNKMKRWVREVYKNEEDKLKRGYNIIVMYKKGVTINDLDYFKIYEDIKKCFKGLDLYE
ncbi:MAG: ribonuclease P protein component [Clostridia bacterium]|nr:ribonuclease P protein component [Clostridia bacterium]